MGLSIGLGVSLTKSDSPSSIADVNALNAYIASLNAAVLEYRFDEESGNNAINYGSAGSDVNGTYSGNFTLGHPGILGSSVLFDGAVGTYLSLPFHASWADLTTFEWMYIYKLNSTQATTRGRITGSDNFYALGVGIRVAGLKRVAMINQAAGIFVSDTKYIQPSSVWCGYNWNFDNAGDRIARMYLNGVEEPIYTAQQAMTGTFKKYTGGIRLFQREINSTAIVGGAASRWLLFSRKLTTLERQTIISLCGLQQPVYTRQIICTGDSLTAGLTGGDNSYPCQLAGLLINGSAVRAYGVSGEGADTIIPKAATREDLDVNTLTGADDILVAWVGLVNLYAGAAAATVQADYQTYCAARQSAGYKVIACTVTPSNSVTLNYETRRQAFNTWLRANYTSFADRLADIGADPTIGDANDYQNTTYYADGLHMTAAGYAIVAQIVADAVNSL